MCKFLSRHVDYVTAHRQPRIRGRVSVNYVLMIRRRGDRSVSVLSGLRAAFCIPPSVKAGTRVHPHSCPVSMGVSFRDVNRAVVGTHSSPPSITEVKCAWSDTSTPTSVLTAWCLIKHKHNFAQIFRTASIKVCNSTRYCFGYSYLFSVMISL
jgi:hypothetical protein